MTLSQLRAFALVARLGSMRAAALALGFVTETEFDRVVDPATMVGSPSLSGQRPAGREPADRDP